MISRSLDSTLRDPSTLDTVHAFPAIYSEYDALNHDGVSLYQMIHNESIECFEITRHYRIAVGFFKRRTHQGVVKMELASCFLCVENFFGSKYLTKSTYKKFRAARAFMFIDLFS